MGEKLGVLLDLEGPDQLNEVHLEACYCWCAFKDQCRGSLSAFQALFQVSNALSASLWMLPDCEGQLICWRLELMEWDICGLEK